MSSLARIAVLLTAFTIVLASPNLAAEDGEHTHPGFCGFDPAKHWKLVRSQEGTPQSGTSATPRTFMFNPKKAWPPGAPSEKSIITFEFVTSQENLGPFAPPPDDEDVILDPISDGTDSDLGANAKDNLRAAFKQWEDHCGVIFVEKTDGTGAIRIGKRDIEPADGGNASGTLGLGGSYANSSGLTGPAFVQMDTDPDWGSDLDLLTAVAAHEMGHAIGINHTNKSGALMFPTVSSTTRPQDDDCYWAQQLYSCARGKLGDPSPGNALGDFTIRKAYKNVTGTNSTGGTGSNTSEDVIQYRVERKVAGAADNTYTFVGNATDSSGSQNFSEGDPTFTFTDNPTSGDWTYRIRVEINNLSSTAIDYSDELTITVNTGPVAVADSYNMSEEGTLTVTTSNDVLTNDDDPAGGGLTAIKVTDPSHAQSFTFNSDGTFTYTPVANYFGTDSFTYKVEDITPEQSGSATVTINISNVNDNPTLTTNAGLTVNEGAQGTIGSSKLLVSDIDNTTSQITFTLTTAPTNGSLRNNTTTINASGTFTQANVSGDVINYLHNGGEPTTDSFQVTVSDGSGGGGNLGTITFNITITPQNDAPTLAANTGLTVNEGAQGTINNTKLQATDPDSGTLTFTLQTAPANGALRNNTTTISQGQTFTQANINANVINYLHNGGETTSDSFVFSVSDGSGGNIGNTTFNISVTAVNDNPTLTTNAGLTVNEGAQGTVDNTKLLVSDVDSGTITFTLTSAPANGTLRNNTTTINASGTFTQANIGAGVINYLHNGGETTTDSFQVTVSDGNGGGGNLGTITFNITITPVNDPPVASITTPNASEVDVTEADTVDFVAFATDPENDSLTYTWDFGDGTGDTGTNVSHQFAPGSYVVTVTVSDGNGGVDVASVTVNVAGGASDGALLVLKGSFTVAWSSHAKSQLKDKFTLAGTLNPSGLPAVIPGGAEVEVWANAAGEAPVLLTGAAMPLDAKGSSSGAALDGTDKFKVKVSPKNGKYSVSVSNTDLRSVLGLTENAATNQTLPVEANLVFKNVPTMAFPSLLGNCEFLYTTKQSSSSKGKFALKSNDLLSGAFVALKTSAAQDKASSDYKVTLTASMVSGGGGPVEPTGPVTVTIGGADPIVIPNGQLVLKGSGPSSTYTLAKGGAPGLLKFSISNSKKSLSLATDLLPSTGIPVVNDPGLEHELTITIDVEVNGGDTHTFDTTVELMRSSITTGKWKR